MTSWRAPSPDATDEAGASTAESLDLAIQGLAEGDPRAFARLYDATGPQVYGVAFKVLGNASMAEETVQEVFLEVWRKASLFNPARGSARAWLSIIARRRALDRLRTEQAHTRRAQRAGWQPPPVPDDVIDLTINLLEESAVRAALADLAPQQRRAIELAYLGGNTYRQVALMLGTPEGTVKTHIRKGLAQLRQNMSQR